MGGEMAPPWCLKPFKEGRGTFSESSRKALPWAPSLASGAFAVLLRGFASGFQRPRVVGAASSSSAQSRPCWSSCPGWCGRVPVFRKRAAAPIRALRQFLVKFLPTFLFLILLMTAFMTSHGTRLVPRLSTYAKLKPATVGTIRHPLQASGSFSAACSLEPSQKWGHKRAIVAVLLSIPNPALGLWSLTVMLGAVLCSCSSWSGAVRPAVPHRLSPGSARHSPSPLRLGGLVTSSMAKPSSLGATLYACRAPPLSAAKPVTGHVGSVTRNLQIAIKIPAAWFQPASAPPLQPKQPTLGSNAIRIEVHDFGPGPERCHRRHRAQSSGSSSVGFQKDIECHAIHFHEQQPAC